MDERMTLFWVVGESSGDHHAAHLMREIIKTAPDWKHRGMGGGSMRNEGCDTIADISEASLMGLTEVIRHLPWVIKLRNRLIE